MGCCQSDGGDNEAPLLNDGDADTQVQGTMQRGNAGHTASDSKDSAIPSEGRDGVSSALYRPPAEQRDSSIAAIDKYGTMDGKSANKSLKPPKKHKEGTKRWQLHELVMNTLTLGTEIQNIKKVVQVPPDASLNEWLTIHVIDFYNEVSLLYGILTDLCTAHSCPIMSAGPKFKYLWADGIKIKQPIEVSARTYIDCLLDWLDGEISDPSKYPLDSNIPYPPNFVANVKVAFKRLFRVYAHIYHSHFRQFVSLEAQAHLNTCFKHFIFFVREFDLVEDKQLDPLKMLITSFEQELGDSGKS